MPARSSVTPHRDVRVPTCNCAAVNHPEASLLDAELRLLGTPSAPEGSSLSSVAKRYKVAVESLSLHRTKHLKLPPLQRGLKRVREEGEVDYPEEAREAFRTPSQARQQGTKLPATPEGQHAQLVKTVATLIALGSYRGLPTVRALAARHGVSEEEVVRAHRRASLSVRDARGGLREQLELSVGLLTQVRDEERKVAQDYTGIAERIVAQSLPTVGPDGRQAPPQRAATAAELERAKSARMVAAQAQDCAIAAQRQIDQNTIHRRTAPLVQVSFSANPDFTRAQDALVMLLCAVVGDERADRARQDVARGLQVLEDAGENLDAPEFVEYLAELRRDWGAADAPGEAAE